MRDYREIMKNIENVYRDNIVKERRKAIRRRRIGLGASIVLAVAVIALLIFSRQNRMKNNYEPGGIYIASADADMAFVAQLHITSAKLSGGCVSAQIRWDGKTRFEPDACEWYLTDKSGRHYDIRLSDTASAEQLVFDVSEAVDEEAQVTLICKKDNIIYRKRVMRHGEAGEEETETQTDQYPQVEPIEGMIMPYSIWTFNGWRKENATYTDGIWYGRFVKPFVPVISIPVYENRDLSSPKSYLSVDGVYYAEASDTENWIYMDDKDGNGGWLHVKYDSNGDYLADIEGTFTEMSQVFIYNADGDDVETPYKAYELEDAVLDDTQDFSVTEYEEFEDMLYDAQILGVSDAAIAQTERMNHSAPFNRMYLYRVPGKLVDSRFMYDSTNDRIVIMVWYEPDGTNRTYCQMCNSQLDNEMKYVYAPTQV